MIVTGSAVVAAVEIIAGDCCCIQRDIDIAVVVNKVPGDYLDAVSLLWKLTRSIGHDIEPMLLTAADDESGFLQTVQQTGIAV